MSDKPKREWSVSDAGQARVYRVRGQDGFGWAIATIREWDGGGQIDIQSDFGNYAFIWTAIGKDCLRQFLCRLDIDYFLKKTRRDCREFDADDSANELRRYIIERRRERRMTAEDARDAFDDIRRAIDDCCDNEHLYAREIMSNDWAYKVTDGYPPHRTRIKPECQAFWDGPWAALCEHWKLETAAVAA